MAHHFGHKLWLRIKRDTTSTDWLIVVLTAVIAGTSYLQWHEIRAGSADTHALAQAADTQAKKMGDMSSAADKIRRAAEGMVAQEQKMADNSQKSLDASNRQSKLALDASIAASRQDQRAWLGAGDYTYTIAESGPIDGTTILTNTGKSPAIDIVCRTSGATRLKGAILTDSDIVYPPESPILKVGTLFPNQHIPLSAGGGAMEPAIQKQWFEHIQNGEWVQYFFGVVRYKDAFNRDHWTQFCTQFVPTTKKATPCSIYNDTDDRRRTK